MEELYKKDLHDPANHDDMITNLEPDILECEVKWALESITTNKASGGDGIPVELFQILILYTFSQSYFAASNRFCHCFSIFICIFLFLFPFFSFPQ